MPRELKQTAKKAGRRGNNEGSIYQRNNGRWYAQATIGYDKNGKILKKYVYDISRVEVARKLTKYTQEVFENGYAALSPNEKIWFAEVFEEWFITFKEPNISSPTVEKLRNLMKNHIFKTFNTTELSQIDLLKLQRFSIVSLRFCLTKA